MKILFTKKFKNPMKARFSKNILSNSNSGGSVPIASVYIGEISDRKSRGKLGSCLIALLAIGLTCIMIIGVFLPWKVTCLICTAPMVIGAGLLAYVSDSPYFLYARGREEEARRAVDWLHGGGYKV